MLLYGAHEKQLSGGEANTTNNRMELSAVIFALEALKEPCHVVLYSDSQYVCNALKLGWAKKWRANGWMRNKKEPALNPELWERLLTLCEKHELEIDFSPGTRSVFLRTISPPIKGYREDSEHQFRQFGTK